MKPCFNPQICGVQNHRQNTECMAATLQQSAPAGINIGAPTVKVHINEARAMGYEHAYGNLYDKAGQSSEQLARANHLLDSLPEEDAEDHEVIKSMIMSDNGDKATIVYSQAYDESTIKCDIPDSLEVPDYMSIDVDPNHGGTTFTFPINYADHADGWTGSNIQPIIHEKQINDLAEKVHGEWIGENLSPSNHGRKSPLGGMSPVKFRSSNDPAWAGIDSSGSIRLIVHERASGNYHQHYIAPESGSFLKSVGKPVSSPLDVADRFESDSIVPLRLS